MNQMTQPSRQLIPNVSPRGLRQSTLPLGRFNYCTRAHGAKTVFNTMSQKSIRLASIYFSEIRCTFCRCALLLGPNRLSYIDFYTVFDSTLAEHELFRRQRGAIGMCHATSRFLTLVFLFSDWNFCSCLVMTSNVEISKQKLYNISSYRISCSL